MMGKCITALILSLILPFSFVFGYGNSQGTAKGSFGGYTLILGSNVKGGEGTLDEIDDIPGYDINGLKIYIGYLTGTYSSDVKIKDTYALNATESDPADIILDAADADQKTDTAVTIYLAADANVQKNTSVSLSFNTGAGWVREGSNNYSIEIISSPSAVENISYPRDTNVLASVSGNVIRLDAMTGSPKGENTPVVAYSVLTWPNDGIPAGNYNADVSVVIVNEG